MRTAMILAFVSLSGLSAASSARADSPQQFAHQMRENAHFDHARAAEFNKLASEDDAVAQQRMRQAADLDNSAAKYEQRANFHRQIAAQFGNNPDQIKLANESDALARSLHGIANERRSIVTSLQAHVQKWRTWAQNLEQRAINEEAVANRLQAAGSL